MKRQETPGPEERPSHVPVRKPYEKPQLQIYGDLAKMTKSVAGSQASDGSGHPNKHFTS